jgi:O-antigen/teichoic acid export membrane protein
VLDEVLSGENDKKMAVWPFFYCGNCQMIYNEFMSRLFKNTAIITIALVFQKALAFFYFSILSKYLGVSSTGEYFLALAVITVVAVVADFGTATLLVREVAKSKNESRNIVQNIVGIKLFAIPVALLILLLVPNLLNYDDSLKMLIYFGGLILIADTLSLTFYATLRGLQKLKYEAFGMMSGQIISAITGVFFILVLRADLMLLLLALTLGSLFNMFFSGYMVGRYLGFSAFTPRIKNARNILTASFAFFLATVFTKIYSYVDTLLLQYYLGAVAVGTYAIAYKLTYAFQFLPMAFVAALYPAMSAVADSPKKLSEIFSKSIWYVSILSFPIVFGIFMLAEEIIILYSSIDFIKAVIPLQILIFVLLFIFLDFPLGSILNASGRQMKKTLVMALTMIINIAANFALIPALGPIGASIAGLISFIFMFFADWFMMRDLVEIGLLDIFKISAPFALSAITMSFSLYAMSNFETPILLMVPIAAIVYFIFCFIFGGISRQSIEQLWREN